MLLQVLSFLDVVTSSSLLKLVRGLLTPKAAPKGKKKENTEAEDMDIDEDEPVESNAAPSSKSLSTECSNIINNLADLFQHFGLRDQPDIVRAMIETLAHVTRNCTAGVPQSSPVFWRFRAYQKRCFTVQD